MVEPKSAIRRTTRTTMPVVRKFMVDSIEDTECEAWHLQRQMIKDRFPISLQNRSSARDGRFALCWDFLWDTAT